VLSDYFGPLRLVFLVSALFSLWLYFLHNDVSNVLFSFFCVIVWIVLFLNRNTWSVM